MQLLHRRHGDCWRRPWLHRHPSGHRVWHCLPVCNRLDSLKNTPALDTCSLLSNSLCCCPRLGRKPALRPNRMRRRHLGGRSASPSTRREPGTCEAAGGAWACAHLGERPAWGRGGGIRGGGGSIGADVLLEDTALAWASFGGALLLASSRSRSSILASLVIWQHKRPS
jgi:hypothetical protein